jgi:pimeloyl-ACP methyl ester carboxylesterase
VCVQTVSGKQVRETVIPFIAGDGMACNLIHIEGDLKPQRGPVLLVHGAGVRANLFRPPVKKTIVDALLEAGYDVWLENWRASIDLPPNRWTLDQAALYDHPKAVQIIVERAGSSSVKAITHCQGSTSFTMSAIAGLVPEVKLIVSNAVSLHPVIPALSSFKLNFVAPLFRFLSDYMNPQWGVEAPTWPAKVIQAIVSLTHHECDNPICKQVSFTYGSGFPSLWSHENLSQATHDWICHEFAACSMNFFRQIARCARVGHLVSVEGLPGLPADFPSAARNATARFAFFAGEDNMCFYPESQRRSFVFFDGLRPNYHSLHVIPKYGHLDMFIGERAATEVFPLILSELERTD